MASVAVLASFVLEAPANAQDIKLGTIAVGGASRGKPATTQRARPQPQRRAPAVARRPAPAPARVVAAPAAPASASPPPERADGPIRGYVAARSATGSKTDTPLIETPQSISVIGRREIQDRDATTLQEVLAYTPGVATFASGRSLFLDEFLIRGFDTSGGDLGQLRDGLKLQSNVYDGSQEPYGLERVEVLKGAASILYGQLGPGGVVNSITKRPTFVPQGEINVTGGSFNNKQVSADVSGPLGGPNSDWAYRLTGLFRNSDTWMDYIPDNKIYVAPAVTWKPDSRTQLTILGYYQNIDTRFKAPVDAFGTVFPIAGVGRIPSAEFIGEPSFDKYNINSGTAGYLFEHEFDDNLKFNSKFRYYEAQADWNYLTFLGIDTTRPRDPQIQRGVSQRLEHSSAYTADNNLQYKFNTGPVAHTSIVGFDFVRSVYDTHRLRKGDGGELDLYDPVYGVSLPNVSPLDTGFRRQIEQGGLYFQDQMKLGKLVFLGGGRQDWAQTHSLLYTGGPQPTQVDKAFTGRAGVVLLGPYGFAPYASFSQSFSPVIAVEQGANMATKPTTGEQYETGIRWQSPDEKTLLSAAFYTIDQRNVVTFDSNFDLRQSGLVRSQGLELEGKTNMGNWQLTASYAYTDAKTLQDLDPLRVGKQTPLVPFHQASVFAIRDLTSLGLRGLSLGAGLRYFGETNLIPVDTGAGIQRFAKVPGYVLVDAVVKMDFGALRQDWKGVFAQVNATNLFDKTTFSCADAIQGCNYGQPLTVVGTLSYKW